MKVVQKSKVDDRLTLKATADAKEVSRAFQSAKEAFAAAMGIVPVPNRTVEDVVRERMGIRDLDAIVAQDAVNALTPLALDKKNIIPAFPPKVAYDQNISNGQPFTFMLDVTLRPEYELSSYEPVSVEVQRFVVDESQVDAEIAQIVSQYTAYVRDNDAPADYRIKDGDYIKVSIDAKGEDGKPMSALSTSGRTYLVGAGHMPEGFDEGIRGMMAGETRSVRFEVPGFDDDLKEVKKPVCADVTVIEVQKEVAPGIDDEWVAKNMPMYKDAESMRKAIRKSIEIANRESYDAYVRQLVVQEWAKRFEGKISDEAYESMRDQLKASMVSDLRQQGRTWEEFEAENGGASQTNMLLLMQARDVLQQGYVLDAIFRHFGLSVTDKDIEAVCHAMNPQVDPKQLRRDIEAHGQGFALRETAERYKANAFAVDNADITYTD